MAEQLGWSKKEKERQTNDAMDFLKKQMGKGANRWGTHYPLYKKYVPNIMFNTVLLNNMVIMNQKTLALSTP